MTARTLPPSSNTLFILLSIIALALPAAATSGCSAQASSRAKGPAAPAQEPSLKVAVVKAGTADWPSTLLLTGTLNANRDSDVAADAMGKVMATHVERGSVVKKGAPLVTLDRRSVALAQEQAKAQAAIAQTQLELARSECERTDRLYREAAINRAEHDRSKSECEAARLRAEAASASARLAGKSFGDAIVRAPFAGMVVEKFVTEGEYVRPDMRVVRLVEMDSLRLELAVPEAVLAQVTASQDVAFRVAAFAGERFTGRIRYVGSAVRKESRDLVIEAIVDNKHGRLRPGMFATAEVTTGQSQQVVVPKAAVRLGDDTRDDRVFVVNNGKIEERLVKTTAISGDQVALASGLSSGEQVVANAEQELRDGQPAQIANP